MTEWACEAYGPDGASVGARCFVAGELKTRVCADAEACARTMTTERQRVYDRILELAATGDETSRFLADTFTNPGTLLNASAEDEPT